MKTFKDIGFELDSFTMHFIVEAIRGVKKVKVEDMADTLTDRKPHASFTEDEIQWMKNTPVQKITMGDTYTENSSDFFDLLVSDQSKLKISARSTSNGEFRGNIVREVIDIAKSTNDPNLTVYGSFQAHISTVANNANYIYATAPAIGNFLQDFGFDPKSQIFIKLRDELKDRLNAFGQSIFESLEEFDGLYLENEELTEQAQQFLQGKLQVTLDEKPISQDLINFMNAFKAFEDQLSIITKKSESFEVDSKAHTAATELTTKLSNARDDLISGDMTIDQFKTYCDEACSTAERSALKEHRGWKQVFSNIVFAVASIATLGIANIISKVITGSYDFSKTNTDSINKLKEMKEKLNDIRSNIDNKDESSLEDGGQVQNLL